MKETFKKENNFTSLMEKGLSYFQFQNLISNHKNVFASSNALENGGCIKVYKIVNVNGLELMVHMVNIYAGTSIRNSPDYNGNLEEFAKNNLERVMIKTFDIDSSKRYHRRYLRKIKSM
jgi:hypothetical protein